MDVKKGESGQPLLHKLFCFVFFNQRTVALALENIIYFFQTVTGSAQSGKTFYE